MTSDANRAEVERIRTELAQTLDAIEDKVNVPRKVKRAVDRTGARVRAFAKESPLAFAGVALAAAVIVGGVVVAVVKSVTRD
jgi:hypothetical protein